jgi:hypothetical protein
LVAKARQGRLFVHRCDRPIKQQGFRYRRKPAPDKRSFKTAEPLQQSRSAGCADAWHARDFVGSVTTQGDEIRNLSRIDAITLSNFVGANACHLACADRVENGGAS